MRVLRRGRQLPVRRGLTSAVLLLAALGVLGCSAGRRAAPKDGSVRTEASAGVDLTLTGLQGRQLDLASLRGKVVVVDVWATWCAPCVRALPGLARLSQSRPADLAVVGILSGDDPRNLERFLRSQPVPYFVGLESAAARALFPASALPTVYVLDRDGRIVDKMVGGVPESVLIARAARFF